MKPFATLTSKSRAPKKVPCDRLPDSIWKKLGGTWSLHQRWKSFQSQQLPEAIVRTSPYLPEVYQMIRIPESFRARFVLESLEQAPSLYPDLQLEDWERKVLDDFWVELRDIHVNLLKHKYFGGPLPRNTTMSFANLTLVITSSKYRRDIQSLHDSLTSRQQFDLDLYASFLTRVTEQDRPSEQEYLNYFVPLLESS